MPSSLHSQELLRSHPSTSSTQTDGTTARETSTLRALPFLDTVDVQHRRTLPLRRTRRRGPAERESAHKSVSGAIATQVRGPCRCMKWSCRVVTECDRHQKLRPIHIYRSPSLQYHEALNRQTPLVAPINTQPSGTQRQQWRNSSTRDAHSPHTCCCCGPEEETHPAAASASRCWACL